MLVQRPLRPIRSLASVHRASVVPFDLIGSPPEPFLPVFIASFTLLDFLTLFLEFGKLGIQFIPLVHQFSHLGHEDHICQVESTVLMVVIKVCIGFCVVGLNHDLFY